MEQEAGASVLCGGVTGFSSYLMSETWHFAIGGDWVEGRHALAASRCRRRRRKRFFRFAGVPALRQNGAVHCEVNEKIITEAKRPGSWRVGPPDVMPFYFCFDPAPEGVALAPPPPEAPDPPLVDLLLVLASKAFISARVSSPSPSVSIATANCVDSKACFVT